MSSTEIENTNINIQNNIDEYGCEMIEVDGNEYFPSYIYTIGLYQQFNHPEIVCFGLSSDTMITLLNQIKDNIEDNNLKYKVGEEYKDFLPKGYPITFLNINSVFYSEYFETAVDFYGNIEFPFYQLVWPDHSKLFPWQKNFDEQIKYNQPLLDRNSDFFFIEDRNLNIFTTENILLKKKEILFVEHDEDGDWFFLEKEDIDEDTIIMSTLQKVVELDSSINNLFTLDYNQYAIRTNSNEDWSIEL